MRRSGGEDGLRVPGSGVILDKPDHEAFEVLDVLKGSAAERAGLRRDDRIIEIAGHPARELGYAGTRTRRNLATEPRDSSQSRSDHFGTKKPRSESKASQLLVSEQRV
jgi:C-terminal processing protease CtpA/Prc